MKDELYELLDGGISDDAAAELLHILSVDPDKRIAFRQHLQLQGALYRNDGHDAMTPDEEAEMTRRVGGVIGISSDRSPVGGMLNLGMIGLLLLGLALGTGFGYMINEWTPPNTASPSPTVQVIEPPSKSALPVTRFDRDSVVSFLRDSLAQSFRDSVAQMEEDKPAVKKNSRRRSHATVKSDTQEGAVTGMPVKKGKHRRR